MENYRRGGKIYRSLRSGRMYIASFLDWLLRPVTQLEYRSTNAVHGYGAFGLRPKPRHVRLGLARLPGCYWLPGVGRDCRKRNQRPFTIRARTHLVRNGPESVRELIQLYRCAAPAREKADQEQNQENNKQDL